MLNYYKNIGSGGALSFVNVSSNFGGLNVSAINSITGYSAPLMFDNGNGYELFVASESGLIYHYNNIENNLAGSFNLIDSNYQDINEPKRATIALDDYNQDGKKDFIVGNGAGGVRAYLNTTSNFTSENLADFDFEILPNPSVQNTPLFIKLPTNCRNANLKIFNVIGQQVYSQELTGRFSVIDNLILSKGEYLVSIDFAGRTFTKKLIRL